MDITPYIDAPINVQIHAMSALAALVVGPIALYQKRRNKTHKRLGYVWVSLMALVATSSFSIGNFGLIGPFSPIHLFAIFTFVSLWVGVRSAIAGNLERHKRCMRNLYWYGLCLAGLFNFLPGRATNRMFFNDAQNMGLVVIALGVIGGGSVILMRIYLSRKTNVNRRYL